MNEATIKETMFKLAELASVETMAHFRQTMQIENKLDQGFDPVTLADKNAEAVIRNYLLEHFPSHGVLGEEQAAYQSDAEYCWIIDPIDGTRAFISGLPGWGTLIGLSKNQKPIAGIMAQPFTGEHFYTCGSASYLLHNNETKMIETSAVTDLNQATMMSTDPHIIAPQCSDTFHALRKSCKLTRYGYDCYAYALLAAGSIELVVETELNAYDISALIPIIENAGGYVTNWQGHSAADGGNIIAAANKAMLENAIEILAI